MKILAMPADKTGCAYFRMALPLNALKLAGGHTLATGGVYDVRNFDIMVGQRVCRPEVSEEWQRLAAHKSRDYRMVFELDDDLWHIDPLNTMAYEYFHRGKLNRMAENIRVSDLVTVSTEVLADWVYQWNTNVIVLPNMIDGAMLHHQPVRPTAFVAGFGGSASHSVDWKFCGKGISRFLRQNKDAWLMFVGSEFSEYISKDVWPQLVFSQWAETVQSYYRKMKFTVGVAPLAPSLFNQSKSDLRILECSALGIPMVASDYEPYLPWKDAVLFAHNEADWARQLRAMKNDPDMRTELAAKGKAIAATRTINGHWQDWEDAYQSVL